MLLSKYIAFALIATAMNLLTQVGAFALYHGPNMMMFALLSGTVVGLVVKYVLDKNYIFYHQSTSYKETGSTFFFYSLVGVFTTIIFWFTEISFDYYFSFDNAKYLGGAIGLAIGYWLKYQLDKRFVFRNVGSIQ